MAFSSAVRVHAGSGDDRVLRASDFCDRDFSLEKRFRV